MDDTPSTPLITASPASTPATAAGERAPATESAEPILKMHVVRVGGGKPLLDKKRYGFQASQPWGAFVAVLRHLMKLAPSESLFVYLKGAFSPAPNQLVGDLHRIFGVDGELVVHYSLTPAYG